MALDQFPPQLPPGASTESKQDTGNSSLATIAGKDFATQTTLSALLAKVIAAPSTEAKQDSQITQAASTNTKLDTANGHLSNLSAIGITSVNNSTSTPLNAGVTFTGTADNNQYPESIVVAYTDQDGTLYCDFSTNGTNWDSTLSFTVTANTNEIHRLVKGGRYMRIRFTNTSASNQTFLRLTTYYGQFPQLTSALNSVVQQDADANVARTISDEITIAAGLFAGYSIVNKAGIAQSFNTGATPLDIWELSTVYTGFPLTSGETITVLSSSANDAAAGTGARTIRISGLDANYVPQTEDFTLNGTTPVTGVKTFVRVHTAQVLTSGGSNNDNFNAGIITIRHTTTTANVFLSMRAGVNQTNCSAYTIPAGYTGYVRKIFAKINAGSANTSAVDFSIWTQSALKTNAPRLRRPSTANFNFSLTDDIFGGVSFPEKTDLILRVTLSAQNGTILTGMYDLILVKN